MKKADVNGPAGLVIESMVYSSWDTAASKGVATSFGTFLFSEAANKYLWVRDARFSIAL